MKEVGVSKKKQRCSIVPARRWIYRQIPDRPVVEVGSLTMKQNEDA